MNATCEKSESDKNIPEFIPKLYQYADKLMEKLDTIGKYGPFFRYIYWKK